MSNKQKQPKTQPDEARIISMMGRKKYTEQKIREARTQAFNKK